MKILLLGATGFIGRSLAAIRPQWEWTLCNSTTFNLLNFTGEIDYHDVIINCAGWYGGLPFNKMHREQIMVKNTQIFATVDRITRQVKPKKVVSIGSGCIYPGNVKDKMTEDLIGTGPYHESVKYSGIAKKLELDLLHQLPNTIGWEFLILCNVYGPGEHTNSVKSHVVGGLIKKFLNGNNKLLGTGTGIRDFFYITDAAEAICRFAEIPSTNSHTNISSGKGTAIKDLVKSIAKYTNVKDLRWSNDPNDDGVPIKILDNKKMQSIIGSWEYCDLDTGVKNTVDFIKKRFT